MRSKFIFLLIFLILTFPVLSSKSVVYSLSPDCDQAASNIPKDKWDTCRQEYEKEADLLSQANATNRQELVNLQKQLTNLSTRIKALGVQINNLEKDIAAREIDLGVQGELLGARLRDYYVRSRYYTPMMIFFSSRTASQLTKELAFRQSITNQDKKVILSLSSQITQLKQDKDLVNKNKNSLASLEKTVSDRAKFLSGEVAKTETYLAVLSAKQQELLALKAGGFSTTVGDVPPADDPASRPDYNPGFSPAFAAFSFGVPHFKGMSQYGAYGRAKAGQGAEEILRAYYGGVDIKKDYDPGRQISVQGYGRMDIETYTKRIYEMPSGWGDSGGFEALKAQAVAARTYALAWTREGTGGAICTTQNCQVYKNANKGGKWEEAVNATRGWVLMKDGKLISSWYASTSGGYQQSYNALDYLKNGSTYNTPSFWDTSNGRAGWTDQAYEKLAGSPWFYKAWYRIDDATCGNRNNPWLTSSEMADILNAWQIIFHGGGDAGRIFPPDGCGGGSPYSRSELQSLGGFTDVSGVSQVIYRDDGSTASVSLITNKGVVTISGDEFKKAFNLRAPGNIGIKSALFNLVKK